MIRFLTELPAEQLAAAGGKGATLARLAQAGYPVPDGFVILPTAFDGDELTAVAWEQIRASLARLRAKGTTAFAVRSSASTEDSAQASFAGQFTSVLGVEKDEDIRTAILTVRASAHSLLAQAYGQAQRLDTVHEIAVVVQTLVHADIAGVLSTVDPVTGSRAHMVGNFVHGLGQRLASGEANAQTFTFWRPRGQYDGPDDLRPVARKLYRIANRLAAELGAPQDIEWAVVNRRVLLLQVRPITALSGFNPRTGERNDSLAGDYLWTKTNLGEAMPDVLTPYSESLGQIFVEAVPEASRFMPKGYLLYGNICGHPYFNLSLILSVVESVGIGRQRLRRRIEMVVGRIPHDLKIPLIPFSRWWCLRNFMVPTFIDWIRLWRKARKLLPDFLTNVPARVSAIRAEIGKAQTPDQLVRLWRDVVRPIYYDALSFLYFGLMNSEQRVTRLRLDLEKLVAEEDINALLSGLDGLESLGPLIGLSQVVRGEMDRETYAKSYGHRSPHEAEFSMPRPEEDPDWIEQQLSKLADVDIDTMLSAQRSQHNAAWECLKAQHPIRAKLLGRRLARCAEAARLREATRSEGVRVGGLCRDFALRAGEFTGLGDDIFFLTIDEVLALLSGDDAAISFISARRQTHARYRSLPPYPVLINGRFDPFEWAADPHRRSDLFDSHQAVSVPRDDTIRGFAGAAGVVEGQVRLLNSTEEGHQLQAGEILVAPTTNIGWTPLFPLAAAIVTDVGAPLSHAAIVARELGIPAVVGCGNATMLLRTGDRVRVNGAQGTVEVLEKSQQ